MTFTIALETREVEYELRQSPRARHMRLTIFPGGRIVVTIPRRVTPESVPRFMRNHSDWLERSLKRLERVQARESLPGGKKEYKTQKAAARAMIRERLGHFNRLYGFRIGKISIRNQKSRWGSCSKQGNLSFNFKLVHLPSHLANYIIVHELCHIGEHNHSRRFWALVARTIPDHKSLRKKLHSFSLR